MCIIIQHTFHTLRCEYILLMLFHDCNNFFPYILIFGNNSQWDLNEINNIMNHVIIIIYMYV